MSQVTSDFYKNKKLEFYKNRFEVIHKDFEFQYKQAKKYIDLFFKDTHVVHNFDKLEKQEAHKLVYYMDKFGHYGRWLQELPRLLFVQQRLCNQILVERFGYQETEFDDRGFVKKWSNYQTKNIGPLTKYF